MNHNLRFLVVALLLAYSGLLILGTLYPFGFRLDARSVSYFPSVEWIPLSYHDPRCPWTGFFKDKLFNIVMFLPFGVLLGTIIQSSAKPERILLKTAVLAAFFSLVIESLQYFLPERHPAASDLLMNTFGAFLGAWLISRSLAVATLKLSRST
jgi:VanZ family protein